MEKGKFATVISCIDGRVQSPIAEWMKKNLKVDYVDTITEPGPDKALLGQDERVESIRQKVMISIKAHNSCAIAVAGHYDCAGNPVSEEEHLEQIKKCTEVVASWGLPVRIAGLWVNKQWKVEVVRK